MALVAEETDDWVIKHVPERYFRGDVFLSDNTDFSHVFLQDFVVAMLCGLERPVTSVQNAASWGYFNTVEKTWNRDR